MLTAVTIRSVKALLLLGCFLSTVASQLEAQAAGGHSEREISLGEVAAHLRFLASDELEGRMTGENGNEVAARYIAEQFRAYGLKTLPGADDFMQRVPLTRTGHSRDSRLVIAGDTLRQGVEMLIREGAGVDISAPLVFLGFGVNEPGAGHNDYAEKEVRGKIVVVTFGTPESRGTRLGFEAGREKLRLAQENGALALIELYDGGLPWSTLVQFLAAPKYEIGGPRDDGAAPNLPHILVDNSAGRYEKPGSLQEAASLVIAGSTPESMTSPNVLALLPGNDAKLSAEYVFVTAHFDHLGIKEHSETGQDSIFNGARDNAFGVAALLAAAHSLSLAKPARPVVFMACTAEELGLLGSKYYVENPLVPLNQTVFVLNVDGAGYTDTTIVSVIGLERSSAQNSIIAAAAAFNVEAISDPVPQMNLFNRSDNISFSRKGVPSCSMSPGFRSFGPDLQRYYHRVEDEVNDDFDLNYLLKFSRVFARAARMIADAEKAPVWRSGDEFELLSGKLR